MNLDFLISLMNYPVSSDPGMRGGWWQVCGEFRESIIYLCDLYIYKEYGKNNGGKRIGNKEYEKKRKGKIKNRRKK